MATSAEQDDRDDKHATDAAHGDSGEETPAEDKAGKGEVKAGSPRDEAGDHEEDEAPPQRPAAKPAAKSAGARRSGPGGRGTLRGRPDGRRPPQGSSLGKSMILFGVIVAGLVGLFYVLGREEQQAPPNMKWNVGQTVDVEITLVKNDRNELACAAADEVAGRHCAFESAAKPWTKGDVNDDTKLLKPYTTTDRAQFTAAGVWSEAALAADKIPASRFSLKCRYKIEGKLKNMSVRWEQTGQWFPNNEWFAGSVSECKVVP